MPSRTWRTSISNSPPPSIAGQRLAHSMASSWDLAWIKAKLAISSVALANGPGGHLRLSVPELQARPPRARVQPLAGQQDSGPCQFRGVLAQGQLQLRAGLCAGLRGHVRLANDHEAHVVVLPARFSTGWLPPRISWRDAVIVPRMPAAAWPRHGALELGGDLHRPVHAVAQLQADMTTATPASRPGGTNLNRYLAFPCCLEDWSRDHRTSHQSSRASPEGGLQSGIVPVSAARESS